MFLIISEDKSDAKYQIKAYQPGLITVNEVKYSKSLIIGADQLIDSWHPQSLSEIKSEDWDLVINLKPEIILLGTGKKFLVPKPALLAPIYKANIGFEFMDTQAACRTYMALVSEDRKIIAVLLIE